MAVNSLDIISAPCFLLLDILLDNEDVARLLVVQHNAKRDAQNVHGQVPFDLVPEQEDPKWNGIFVNLNTAVSNPPTRHLFLKLTLFV